eukprot:scaffold139015_cov19-Tisochrysis_lutea.AAC.1
MGGWAWLQEVLAVSAHGVWFNVLGGLASGIGYNVLATCGGHRVVCLAGVSAAKGCDQTYGSWCTVPHFLPPAARGVIVVCTDEPPKDMCLLRKQLEADAQCHTSFLLQLSDHYGTSLALTKVGRKHGVSASAVAVNWALQQPSVAAAAVACDNRTTAMHLPVTTAQQHLPVTTAR